MTEKQTARQEQRPTIRSTNGRLPSSTSPGSPIHGYQFSKPPDRLTDTSPDTLLHDFPTAPQHSWPQTQLSEVKACPSSANQHRYNDLIDRSTGRAAHSSQRDHKHTASDMANERFRHTFHSLKEGPGRPGATHGLSGVRWGYPIPDRHLSTFTHSQQQMRSFP